MANSLFIHMYASGIINLGSDPSAHGAVRVTCSLEAAAAVLFIAKHDFFGSYWVPRGE
jgi:hypothetical protein